MSEFKPYYIYVNSDCLGSIKSHCPMPMGRWIERNWFSVGDTDHFRVSLTKGARYEYLVNSYVDDTGVFIVDADNEGVAFTLKDPRGCGPGCYNGYRLVFKAPATGYFWLTSSNGSEDGGGRYTTFFKKLSD